MAYQGIDSRDLYRRDSGMTLRRLWVLIKALPYDSPLMVEYRAAIESAQKAKPDEIRDRQAAFHRRNEAAKLREASA